MNYKDTFVGIKKIIDKNSVLVRILNPAGTPYSIILEEQNGRFVEMCSIDLIDGSLTEEEMLNNYLQAKG